MERSATNVSLPHQYVLLWLLVFYFGFWFGVMLGWGFRDGILVM
jgi:hypothetical protein